MVTADIATERSLFGSRTADNAAARMVTADIATPNRNLKMGQSLRWPQREWSLPTLRRTQYFIPSGLLRGRSRSANGHCRHCDAMRGRRGEQVEQHGPQREWSLPTLRLSTVVVGVFLGVVDTSRSANGHCRHCDFSAYISKDIHPSRDAAARMVTADIATIGLGRLHGVAVSRSANGHCPHCDFFACGSTWPPEAARKVAGGVSGASDHRLCGTFFRRPWKGRGGFDANSHSR